jgi:adenosylhomocysteine nucleosidase
MSTVQFPYVLFALPRERMYFHETYRIAGTFTSAPCTAFLCERIADTEHVGGVRLPPRVVVMETGVGVERAVRAVEWLAGRPEHEGTAYGPAYVLMAGFAGALSPALHPADLVAARAVIDQQKQSWSATHRHPGADDVHEGRVLTVTRFISDTAEKLALGVNYDALAVDMESAAVARRCGELGVPWGCLRAISDDVRRPLSVEIAELVEDHQVSAWKLTKLLVRRPTAVLALWRLARDTRLAARRLADGLVKWMACCSDG